MSIPEVIDKLKERSERNSRRPGFESTVNKEVLRLAWVYLEDYLGLLEQLKEENDGKTEEEGSGDLHN